MIKITLRLYNLSIINYAGCQDCRTPNEVNQQLNEVLENLNDTVAKIVPSIQTRECSSLVNKINHLTSEFEDLAAKVNQSDEGRVKVHFKSEKS